MRSSGRTIVSRTIERRPSVRRRRRGRRVRSARVVAALETASVVVVNVFVVIVFGISVAERSCAVSTAESAAGRFVGAVGAEQSRADRAPLEARHLLGIAADRANAFV